MSSAACFDPGHVPEVEGQSPERERGHVQLPNPRNPSECKLRYFFYCSRTLEIEAERFIYRVPHGIRLQSVHTNFCYYSLILKIHELK